MKQEGWGCPRCPSRRDALGKRRYLLVPPTLDRSILGTPRGRAGRPQVPVGAGLCGRQPPEPASAKRLNADI